MQQMSRVTSHTRSLCRIFQCWQVLEPGQSRFHHWGWQHQGLDCDGYLEQLLFHTVKNKLASHCLSLSADVRDRKLLISAAAAQVRCEGTTFRGVRPSPPCEGNTTAGWCIFLVFGFSAFVRVSAWTLVYMNRADSAGGFGEVVQQFTPHAVQICSNLKDFMNPEDLKIPITLQEWFSLISEHCIPDLLP